MGHPFLSIVVPAYNETANLGPVVERIVTTCSESRWEFEVVLVDDGSTDTTASVALSLQSKYPPVRVVQHDRNLGLTAALKTGFLSARGEWVTWLPADGQVDADQLPILAAPLSTGADMVLSTYGGQGRPDSMVRLVISRSFRLLLAAGIGFTERLEGTYIFRRSLLNDMTLVSEMAAGSIAWEIAAKAKARGAQFASVEIRCRPRMSGQSKVGARLLTNMAQSAREVLRIRQSMRSERR